MGFSLPPMDAVLGVSAGFVVPPMVTAWVMPMLPASWQTGGMRWVVKAAAVLVPSMLVRQTMSQRIGNFMLIGGAASLVMDAMREFMPGMIPGLGYQPMLGSYYTRPAAEIPYNRPKQQLSQILQGVPERLSPQGRF